jgi:hypothetical protein
MKIRHSLLVVFASIGVATGQAQSQSKLSPAQLDSTSHLGRNQPAQKQTAPAVHAPVLPAKGPIDYRARGLSTPVVQAPFAPAPLIGGADSCVTPDVIVGTGTFAFDNSTATTGIEGQNEILCNLTGAGTTIINDVWFTWVATQSGLAQINTCGLTGVDTKIAIYNASTCPANFTAIACNDDACPGFQSTVNFACVSGQSYVIQIGLYPGMFPPATPGPGTFSLQVFTPPPNDDCTTPTAITGTGTFAYDNTAASTGAQGQTEALCFNAGATAIEFDVWYTWTASFTGWAELRTCNGTFDDTKIAVYAGTGCPGASAIACNDDFCGLQTTTRFQCTSGVQYTIQLGLYPGAVQGSVGSFDVVVGLPPPQEDDCTTPLTVIGTGPFPFDNTLASTGPQGQNEVICNSFGGNGINNDEWFTWTATFTGTAGVETCGSFLDTKVAVYAGSGCPGGAALGCNDDACFGDSRAVFACTQGQVYTFQIGLGAATTFGGPGTFRIVNAAPPTNDDCTTPIALTGLGNTAYDLTFASTGTQGQNEPLCFNAGSTSLFNDIWYTWTAPFTGTAGVRTCGQSDDTKIAVYAGTGCPVASAITCNDDYCFLQSLVTFPVTSGNTYTIQVGLYFPQGGAGQFNVFDAAPPANDSCATPTSVSGAFPGPHPFDSSFASTGAEGQNDAACAVFGSPNVLNDQWFTWIAPFSGQYSVQTIGLTITDTKVAVYDGGGCPAGSALACNDDANEPNQVYLQSQAIFTAVAGNTYTIQLGVSPNSAVGGDGWWSIVPVGAPFNDDCATSQPISGPGPHFFDNTQATTGAEGQGDALCNIFGTTAMIEDIWFTWTPTSGGNARLTFCGHTSTDTRVAVYDGSGCPTSNALACNDDACGVTGYQAEVDFPAVCGQTYIVQVSVYPNYGAPTGGQGWFTITTDSSSGCQVGTVYCAGDGVAPHASCPCGNNSPAASQVGCTASTGVGGRLRAQGLSSLSNDTIVLTADNLPAASTLFFQGTTRTAAGNGAAFGDGLRCASGTVVRLKTYTATGAPGSATTSFPQGLDPSVSVRGQILVPGIRTYQAWYRNAAPFCTISTFNLTNGLEISWGI